MVDIFFHFFKLLGVYSGEEEGKTTETVDINKQTLQRAVEDGRSSMVASVNRCSCLTIEMVTFEHRL